MKTTPIRLVSSSPSGSSEAPWTAGPLSRFHRYSFVLLILLALTFTHRAVGQKFPPDRLSYQGYITDATGMPLGQATPTNYPVSFAIFAAPSGGNALWAETQNVTFDKGQYSVLLGQGTPSVPGAVLSSVLITNRADLFVETTVNLGTPITIKPRLQLIPTPYAFVATRALSAEKADMATTAQSATTATSANTANSAATISGTIAATKITGTLQTGQLGDLTVTGGKIANNTITSGKISGQLATTQIPDLDASKITTGTLLAARMSSVMARRDLPNTFTADQTINGDLTVRDELKLGTAGLKAAAVSENLRIVRGKVRLVQGGEANVSAYDYEAISPVGYTVKEKTSYRPIYDHRDGDNSKGVAEITFNPPFTDVPAVTVTPWIDSSSSAGAYIRPVAAIVHDITASRVIVSFVDAENAGYMYDSPFTFIAVGAR